MIYVQRLLFGPDVQSRAHEGGFAVFSAGGGVWWLRLRLVPVHIPLNYGKVVIHLIYGQQGNLRGNTNTPKVNHHTPGWGEEKGEELVHPCPNLEITINKPVGFKVVVVFPEWIYQLFGHLRSNKQNREQFQPKCQNQPQWRPAWMMIVTFSHPT